tara:strand:+ start:2802 stop:2945 length:144 start_codon:yes stop_codon:yes gene_type:complete
MKKSFTWLVGKKKSKIFVFVHFYIKIGAFFSVLILFFPENRYEKLPT